MTKLLKKAFSKASRLPDEEQNTLAKRVLAEINAEHRWDKLFTSTQDGLAKLAEDTLAKHHSGETKRFNVDDL